MRHIVTGLLCAALLPAVLWSQSIGDLTTGQRIRVSVVSRVTGTLLSIDSGRLVLDAGPPSGQLQYRLDQVRRLEVSNGRRSRSATAGRGFLVGAALGALVSAMQEGGSYFSTDDLIAMGVVTGGTAGLVVGLVLPRAEKWAPVSIPLSDVSPLHAGIIRGSPWGRSGRR